MRFEQALGTIRSDQPVEMQFRGLGFFPNERRPRVVWCGVQGSPNLPKLAGGHRRSARGAGDRDANRGRYVPHLTLARIDAEKVRRAEIGKLVARGQRN